MTQATLYIGLFQPTLPARGATRRRPAQCRRWNFNPRSPHGERPPSMWTKTATSENFNPRSPHGERRIGADGRPIRIIFQPTLPARGATRRASVQRGINDISTHAPRTGSDLKAKHRFSAPIISTHAPRTGSDRPVRALPSRGLHFNPRSPHGERRRKRGGYADADPISTHAPRTGSDLKAKHRFSAPIISTHAPRTGSDRPVRALPSRGLHFNPRSPHGERRRKRGGYADADPISTHAPRTGSDAPRQRAQLSQRPYFNPRSPHGERRTRACARRPSARHFNPRSPHGERRPSSIITVKMVSFQPTLPARGATFNGGGSMGAVAVFQPTLPARGATSA